LLQIRDCVFESPVPPDPTVSRKGIGGLRCDMRVTNCTFIRCSAANGAAIGLTGGEVVVESCTFIECENQAIRVVDEGGPGIRSLEVRDCLFQGIRSSVSGGCVQAGSLDHGITIERCVFVRPMLTEYGNTGAALSLAGPGQKILRDNVFYDMNLGDVGIACVALTRDSALLTGNTFAGCHQPEQPTPFAGSALYTNLMDSVEFHGNIVAYTSGSTALSFLSSQGPITLGCNVFWDNADGIGYELDPTDRVADPQFCDPDQGDLTLQQTSPCLPDLSLGCGLIGALGPGCGTVSLKPETWGRIKAGFRTGEEE
ncbi:hypothetical protein K8I85_02670, partial [bacterium]|nr:hypothetical protein [bacterium]